MAHSFARSEKICTGSRSRTPFASIPQDNIWVTDEGTNMIIKFNPAGRVLMVLGRREEAAEPAAPRAANAPTPPAGWGSFNRPTDVTWDPAGQHFHQ